jgi:DNA replication and repair protein RecF
VYLRSLTLQNFRNYRQQTLSFHPRLNLIVGKNGQGKTNILESIHLLATARAFSRMKTDELITFGEHHGRVKGEFETAGGLSEVHIILSPDGKTITLNGKVVYDPSRILSKFSLVCFLPQDTNIVKGPPSERRRYLDEVICGIDPLHLKDLRQYSRAILQRNSILQKNPALTESIQIWDKQIAEIGARIIKRRRELIKRLNPLLGNTYRTISGADVHTAIEYSSSIPEEGDTESRLREELAERRELDKSRGHTTVGPHRDKPELTLNHLNASAFASQGEAKTLAIALRSSEITLIKNTLGRIPILLLDDISSELDESRKGYLYQLLGKFPGQMFLTATSTADVSFKEDKKIFLIKEGTARLLNPERER